jgi:hypothetical protein
MVKRPKCRLCGSLHYSHEPHEFDNAKAKRADNPLADGPSIGRVYSRAEIEKGTQAPIKSDKATKPNAAAATKPNAAAADRIIELEAEIKALKRALAEANTKLELKRGGRPLIGAKAMTSTERARRTRAKAKRDGTVQFEG